MNDTQHRLCSLKKTLTVLVVISLVPRPSITANTVEGLVKLLRRMTSGGRMVDVQWTCSGRRTFGGVVTFSNRRRPAFINCLKCPGKDSHVNIMNVSLHYSNCMQKLILAYLHTVEKQKTVRAGGKAENLYNVGCKADKSC